MTDPDAFDAELYRLPGGWGWDVFAAGTAVRYATGGSRFRLVAKLQLRRALRRLIRTADADIAFLPVARRTR